LGEKKGVTKAQGFVRVSEKSPKEEKVRATKEWENGVLAFHEKATRKRGEVSSK